MWNYPLTVRKLERSSCRDITKRPSPHTKTTLSVPQSGLADKMSYRVLHNSFFSHCFRHALALVAHSWIRQPALLMNLRLYTTPISVLEMKLWEVLSVHTVCAFIHANNSALIGLKEQQGYF